jgi:uncharacterized Zn finger protein (UPF0148 family)
MKKKIKTNKLTKKDSIPFNRFELVDFLGEMKKPIKKDLEMCGICEDLYQEIVKTAKKEEREIWKSRMDFRKNEARSLIQQAEERAKKGLLLQKKLLTKSIQSETLKKVIEEIDRWMKINRQEAENGSVVGYYQLEDYLKSKLNKL